jgi:hypothetical protein
MRKRRFDSRVTGNSSSDEESPSSSSDEESPSRFADTLAPWYKSVDFLTRASLLDSDPDDHPGGNPGANLQYISRRRYLREEASNWELTHETVYLPLGCH